MPFLCYLPLKETDIERLIETDRAQQQDTNKRLRTMMPMRVKR